jgi:hypothetical protein
MFTRVHLQTELEKWSKELHMNMKKQMQMKSITSCFTL